jgi:hypothetical protein
MVKDYLTFYMHFWTTTSAITHKFAHYALSLRKWIVCRIKIQFKLSNLTIIITDGEMQSDGEASDVVKRLQLSYNFIAIPLNQNGVPLR